MTDSNGVPSNEELLPCPFCGSTPTLEPKGLGKIRAIVCTERPCIGSGLYIACNDDRVESAIAAWNTRAELQRRQQPETESASVPAELAWQWKQEWQKLKPNDRTMNEWEYIAERAAAYGRGQSQWVQVGVARYYASGGNAGLSWRVDEKDVFPIEGEAIYVKREPPTC